MEALQKDIDTRIEAEGLDHKDISDTHHTFGELYDWRAAYNALALNALHKTDPSGKVYGAHKSKKHYDDVPCFGGTSFIVSCRLHGKLVSNHYKLTPDNWALFKIPEAERELWPFHPSQTPARQLQNLHEFLTE